MNKEIKCLPYLKLVGDTYKFVGAYKWSVWKEYLVEKDFDKKFYLQLILLIGFILDDKYFVNSQGILEECEPYCGSGKYTGNDMMVSSKIVI